MDNSLTCQDASKKLEQSAPDMFTGCVIGVHAEPLPQYNFAEILATCDGLMFECPDNSKYFFVPARSGQVSAVVGEEAEKQWGEYLTQRRAIQQKHASEQLDYPYTAADIKGITAVGDVGYAENYVKYHFGLLHHFQTYSLTGETGIYYLDTGASLPANRDPSKLPSLKQIVMAVAGDWGAGTMQAAYVGAQIMSPSQPKPQYTVHIGDVYFVGTEDEHTSNVLGVPPPNVTNGVLWPTGSIGSFGLNGNHEMYSRGYGYFDLFLPKLGIRDQNTGAMKGQKASYMDLENQYWRVIGLDTGYNTYGVEMENKNNTQPQQIIDWLVNTVKIGDPNDKRGIIFLSHHQYYSAFENPSLATPTQLAALVPEGRSVLWFWGHEHRVALYDKRNAGGLNLNVYGRCVGNAGFPPSIGQPEQDPMTQKLLAYDNRIAEMLQGGGPVQAPAGYNGWIRLGFNGNSVNVDYYSLAYDSNNMPRNDTSTLLMSEVFSVDMSSGNTLLNSFKIVNSNITFIQNPLLYPVTKTEFATVA